jgi:hypothetical protein
LQVTFEPTFDITADIRDISKHAENKMADVVVPTSFVKNWEKHGKDEV